MKTKLIAVLAMLFSFTCFAHERAYSPGTHVFKDELDERGYQVTNMYVVRPDGTLKLVEEDTLSKAERYLWPRDDEEVVSIRKISKDDIRVKYKDGHEEQYRLTKDGRLCKGLLSCP